MRYPASEKLEIIRLVEQSHLGVGSTLDKLGIPKTTFYRWCDRFLAFGDAGLEDRNSSPGRVWNRIPDDVRGQIIDLALEETQLSPRELAVRFTDTRGYFVSEASVYRLLKAHGLITSPAFVVIKAADEFRDKTTAPNQLWQTDFTYLKVIGWGWFYLSTILDDYSRHIIAWKLCTNMTADDVTATLKLALERVRHRQNQKGDSQGSQKVIQAMSWVKGGQPWMTRPYSEDLRERVVRVVESGTSRNAAAKQFDVSISFVVKLMQRWKQRGTIKADKYGGWKKSKLAPHGDRIRALVMENCDITIDELCVLLAAEGIEAKRSTLGDFLLAQGLSRKKRQPTPPSRSALTSRRREPLGATSNLG